MADGCCGLKNCNGKEYYCTIELPLLVIGGKWKPIILWHLCQDGVLRFGELRRTIPNITQKMLTQQLRELEADGMVHRKVFAQVPPRVDYSLTELGASVLPVLESLGDWGKIYEKTVGNASQSESAGADAVQGGFDSGNLAS